MKHRVRVAFVSAVAIVAACAGARTRPGYAPVGAPVPRHYDQVCQDTDSGPAVVAVSELFDTAGLGRVLEALAPKPRALTPPWPFLDYITRHDGNGDVVARGQWQTSLDSTTAERLDSVLSARSQALPPLLGPTGFRTRIVFARRVFLGLAGPVECMPHMVHLAGERPIGLPKNVHTWGGVGWVPNGDTSVAVVRIRIGPHGEVAGVDSIRGSRAALEKARHVIAHLRFDPALDNGVAVTGSLTQTFEFTRRRGPTPP